MIRPTLSKQQEADLTRFLRYLAESDAAWILVAGDVFPTFHHDRQRIRDVAHISIYGKPRVKSRLTTATAEKFAWSLGKSIMATAEAACKAPGDYDWRIVEEIAKLNDLGWKIMYYNE